MKVVKFGGSSLADGPQFLKVVQIVQADPQRKVIVTSAPGKRNSHDIKVTDLLIQYAQKTLQNQPIQDIVAQIWDRYQTIADYFDLQAAQLAPLHQVLLDLPQQEYPDANYLMAVFKAHGEYLSARLLTLVLQKKQLAASFWDPQEAGIVVSDQPDDATILPETYNKLHQQKLPEQVLVIPGFYGLTPQQQIATFSRGGSDITGALLARGLQAQMYENFTDVDAIYAVDPQIVPQPQAIKTMTYRELRELSYAGFSVFHDEALLPAIEGQIPINVKNTNHPQLPGTLIVPETNFQPQGPVTGVAGSTHFAALYLHRYLLNKEVGFTLKLLQIFYDFQISYEHMPSGIDDLTVIFNKRQFDDLKKKRLLARIQAVLQPDKLEWIDDYAILMVVGEGMPHQLDVIQDIVNPLAKAQIKIHMINQGASRISIMLGMKQDQAPQAVQKIYQKFFH
ncbi:aspartate kinase [Lactobacillus sp. DCY120]|uniref:Aspartokinase n=1 Tax=Bombilactobacillus apium TaxID=2675299 RepID=A0A850QY79_9LACO|nr:aspartate kinase [Bombilactobacillus apium]NVY95613.1 aspartate kinase [Bombilactobacillus apium]